MTNERTVSSRADRNGTQGERTRSRVRGQSSHRSRGGGRPRSVEPGDFPGAVHRQALRRLSRNVARGKHRHSSADSARQAESGSGHRLRQGRRQRDLLREAYASESPMRPTGWWRRRRRVALRLASGDAYRNMPQHWKVKALIDSGELGPVQSINLYQPTNEISCGGCQGLSVLRMFADDSDVEWVTGWCSEDPWSDEDQNMGGYVKFANGTDAYVHTKPSPRDGIEVVCEKGVYHTSWFGGHLWTSTRRGELGRGRGLLRRVRRDGLRMDDAQRSEAAGGHPVDRRGHGTTAPSRNAAATTCGRCSKSQSASESPTATASPLSASPSKTGTSRSSPSQGRWLNKKEVYGEEAYAEMISSASSKPVAGAALD